MTTQYALTNNKLLVPGKTKIELETGEIHVWYAWLDELKDCIRRKRG